MRVDAGLQLRIAILLVEGDDEAIAYVLIVRTAQLGHVQDGLQFARTGLHHHRRPVAIGEHLAQAGIAQVIDQHMVHPLAARRVIQVLAACMEA